MSNHAHIILTDEAGVLPKFVGTMNSLISRQLNAIGHPAREGTNFAKGYSDIDILDDETMVFYCAYTLANPCSAGLVSRASLWKGVSSHKHEYGVPFEVERPKCGLWSKERLSKRQRPKRKNATENDEQRGSTQAVEGTTMPATITAKLVRPKVMPELSDTQLRDKIKDETAVLEAKANQQRRLKGKKTVGWSRVLKRKWFESPLTPREKTKKKPRVAATCRKLITEAKARIARFNQMYYEALEHYIENEDGRKTAVFPRGTWKMKVQLEAFCGADPPLPVDLVVAPAT